MFVLFLLRCAVITRPCARSADFLTIDQATSPARVVILPMMISRHPPVSRWMVCAQFELFSHLTHNSAAFPARDGDQHERESAEYAKIPEDDKKARDAFASAHGTRYFEFSRLPYFDPVRQIIIDPMHCIFLGTSWCAVSS